MPVGPYSQDVLTRMYNVHWGGGAVIAGDYESNVYYLNFGTEPTWQNLGKLDFRKEDGDFFTGSVAGSAFAVVDIKDAAGNVIGTKPVWVLVGGSGFTGEIGIIMASGDGLNWSRVFTFKGNVNSDEYKSAGIFAVVWNADAKKFFAGGHQTDNFAEGGFSWQAETDILFQSSDGTHWSEVSRHKTYVETNFPIPMPPYPEYKTGLLVAKCADLVKDDNSNSVPDGNYGYDKISGLLIAPAKLTTIDYLYGNYLSGIHLDSSNVTMKIVGGGVPPSYPLNVGIPTTCVATAGGEWVVAGGVLAAEGSGKSQAAILKFVEDDNAYVWKRIDPGGTNMIITLTGG